MIIDNALNKFIEAELLAENARKSAEHQSSGKLSASMLYMPLRFQVLKTIGAPRKQMDAYVISKLQRGDTVELWLVEYLEKHGSLVDKQKFVEYRDTVGYVDALVDSDKMQFNKGIMPHEIKSVTNAKLRKIAKDGSVDYHYKLQGCLYALALGAEYYAIDVVSAEAPFNFTVGIFPTREMKNAVDTIIDQYNEAMEAWNTKRELPPFAPNKMVAWTANLNYAPFAPEWATESDEWALTQLEALGLLKGQNESSVIL